MFQPLYVAATGLNAMEAELLTITDNLANAQTPAFKKGATQMESLPYATKSFSTVLAEEVAKRGDSFDNSFDYGTGVKVSSTIKDFTQGSIKATNNPLDLEVQGDGFFQVRMPDGSTAYTRAGNFHADNEGNIVDPNGHILEPAISLPQGTTGISIRQDGTIFVSVNNQITQTEIGQITTARFANVSGLKGIGQNLFVSTESSGEPTVSNPGDEGYGVVSQYSLESSNVDVISEMMRMVIAQRVFDSVTKAVSTYEGMLTALERMKA